MFKTRNAGISVIVAATATLTLLSGTPALAAPDVHKTAVTSTAAPGDDPSAPDRSATVKVMSSPATTAALSTIQARIARYVANNGTGYTFGSYVDATTGRIVLNTDAPQSVVSALTELPGAATAERQAVSRMQVQRTTTTDMFSRRDDSLPFLGGGGIRVGSNLCSSGYAVRDASATITMITAGHCYAPGSTVQTESGAQTYGTVFNRRLASTTGEPVDLEQISNPDPIPYLGRIFIGGVFSSTGLGVLGAGGAFVGYANYCHSGRTTGEQCGHTARSTSGQICTATGCKSPVIVYTGGNIGAGGDSGAPFYAKDARGAFIRGHVIAGINGTGYVQPWTIVTQLLNVTIVTG